MHAPEAWPGKNAISAGVVCTKRFTNKFQNKIRQRQEAGGSRATGCDSDEMQSLQTLVPQLERDAVQVALHDAQHVHVLYAGATAVVDNSGQAKQQGRQRAAAAQQLQPLVAQVTLVLQRRACMVPRSAGRCTT